MMKRLVLAVVVSCAFGPGVGRAADSPVGTWKTVDDKSGKVVSEVQVYEQGGKFFGKIAGLTEPTDKDGKAKTCTKCEGADKGSPIVGLVIVQGLSLSGDRDKGGTILDPDDGKVYQAELWVDDGKLKLACLEKTGGFEIGVGPSVVVVDEGLARSLTTTTARDDVYASVFDQTGLMAGAGLQGSKIWRIESEGTARDEIA